MDPLVEKHSIRDVGICKPFGHNLPTVCYKFICYEKINVLLANFDAPEVYKFESDGLRATLSFKMWFHPLPHLHSNNTRGNVQVNKFRFHK